MKKLLFIIFIAFWFFPSVVLANYDPMSKHNNKYGIHILFPSELAQAAKLVNTSGGDWGYVTIPLQENDFDLNKWQDFMNDARSLHLIPIVRLATILDPLNTSVWKKPTDYDVIDSANFLNSLTWPTKNRYVVIYNEVNRADEWGGSPDASAYADVLSFAVDAFHGRSSDFFVLSAGLDNAAPNSPGNYINEYDFINLMQAGSPGIFDKVDGIASHAYPNPGFSSPPSDKSLMSATSFFFEKNIVEQASSKDLPVFITETGWDQTRPGMDASGNFKYSFENIWNDPSVVAVTPFVLNAGSGPFAKLSFVDAKGQESTLFHSYQALSKVKGEPILTTKEVVKTANTNRPLKDFRQLHYIALKANKDAAKKILKMFMGTN